MSRTPLRGTGKAAPVDRAATDDVEILEVIGLDEDGAPILASDPEDVEVVFEVEDALAAPPEPSGEEVRLRERLLRLQAEFENFRKRAEKERFDHYRYALSGLVGRLLPVLDNFERAMASARPGNPSDSLLEGFALIQRQLIAELEAEGLRPMTAVGEAFDPIRHEAVATDPASSLTPNTVTEELQRGYFLHDRVLRPALVRVSLDESAGMAGPEERKENGHG